MKRYGLVFKLDDQCWIAEYKDGVVEDACPIDNDEGIYKDLNPRELILVDIQNLNDEIEGEKVTIQDLKTITINHKDDPEKCIVDLIEEGYFPEMAESIWEDEWF